MKSEYKEKLDQADIKTLDDAIEAAQKIVKDEKADKEALEAAAKALNDKLMPIGAKMYESAQKSEKPAEDNDSKGAPKDKKGDGPVEGEVVNDKKD